MQRGQPSTCVRHKDLSCLTTGCSARHVALVTKKSRSFSESRLHLPARWGGGGLVWTQKDGGRCFPRWGGKSGFLFQRAADVDTAHGSPGVCCKIARHLEEARREERTREQRREMRREEQQRGSCLDGVPGKRRAALSDFKCPSCEIVLSNANNLTACLRPTLPSTPSPFIPL